MSTLSGVDLLFVRGQVLDSKARSVCSPLLAHHPKLRVIVTRHLEGDFPNGFGYDDQGEKERVDAEVKYHVAGGDERVCDEENGEEDTDPEADPAA